MGEFKKLNIGCGRKMLDGFVNLDICEGVDVVHDLNKFPYPFEDNTFEFINAEQVIEHLNDIPSTMAELHRISKPEAIIEIRVPYFRSESAFADPTHKAFFTYKTFDYFTGQLVWDVPLRTHLFDYKKKEFEFRKAYRMIGVGLLAKKLPNIYETFFSHIFPAGGLNITLIKKEVGERKVF